MSSPGKMRKTTTRNPLFVPDDLLFNCFSRVSRLHYSTLSLVSKRFGSLLISPDLYKIRFSLGRTENCIYLCLQIPRDPNPSWFTFCRKPSKTHNLSNKSSGKFLVPISSPYNSPSQFSNLAAVDSKIYGIGSEGSISSRVYVLDCQTHKWHEAPRMRVNSSISTASLVDGKIYVVGGSKDCYNSLDWVEVFDTKTQTWDSVTNPGTRNGDRAIVKSLGFEGKLYLFGVNVNVVYSPKDGEWSPIVLGLDSIMGSAAYYSHCVIDNILFFWYGGMLNWYDFKTCHWKFLHVEDFHDFRPCGFCKLVDYGGKMAVLWNELVFADDCYQENKIWCAEIVLEGHYGKYGDEIWGKVEWLDVVLTVPESSLLLNADAFSVTI